MRKGMESIWAWVWAWVLVWVLVWDLSTGSDLSDLELGCGDELGMKMDMEMKMVGDEYNRRWLEMKVGM